MRYPVELNVRYRTLEHKQCIYGTGQTTNLSSGGVLVVTHHEHHLRADARVEIKAKWACPVHGTTFNLMAIGRVVRCGQSNFAVTFTRHEFRIIGRPLKGSVVQSV